MATELHDWHLDRRITILLVIVIIGHAISFGWYASKEDSRMATVEENDHRQTIIINKLIEEQSASNERLAVIQEEIRNIDTLLVKVDEKVEKLIEHGLLSIPQHPEQ